MYYIDRKDAAQRLSSLLLNYKNKEETLILALPRGGVVLAQILAKNLNLSFDVIILKKLSDPFSDELAIGAICEDSIYLNEELINDLNISKEYLEKEILNKKSKILQRKKLYHREKQQLNLKNKTILLVDDGIATGATMIAAILAIKKKEAKKIVAIVPVGPKNTIDILRNYADEIVCPYTPDDFLAISEYYYNFEEITDDKVLKILKESDLF